MRLPALAVLLAAASPTAAATGSSPMSGRWVADLSSDKLPEHPDLYLVQDGRYQCRSCEPPRFYPADGKPRSVPGDLDVTSESVRIAGPRAIVTHIISPELDRETTMTVSADGKTATYVSLDHRPGIKGALRSRYIARRVAPAPPGAHPVSGAWQGIAYLEVPVQQRTIVLRDEGGRLAYSTPLGAHYVARIGGPSVPVQGPFGGDPMFVQVKRVDVRTIVDTRKRGGKVILIRTYRLRGPRALEVSAFDPVTGVTYSSTYRKQ